MPLSKDEQKALAALLKKKDEPEAPAAARSLNISLDLGDEEQVKRAGKLGLLADIFGGGEDEDEDEDKDEDEDQDDVPKRQGYFK